MEKKEAMKILKDFHDKSALFLVRTALDTVFPELVESEDEKIRKALIEHVKGIYKGCCTEEACKERDMFIAWLDKQGAQKPAEWSKEDEEKRKFIEDELSGLIADEKDIESPLTKRAKDLYSALYWLKSLRPQYTWKPSEEQMKFLWKYAEQNNYDGRVLTSLYQDLKKLK